MPRCPNPRCQANYPPGTFQCTNPFCMCLLPDAVIAGRYRIETMIGLGGMGAVYRVSDTFDMCQAALKVIASSSSSMDAQTAVERFRREARYAHQIHHPNIVPIRNFGQDGPLLYFVMDLITGGTLKTLLKAEKPLPVALVQRYLADMAGAVDAVHAHPQQIVHRDIKPSNLLIHQDDGHLVLADFGIARAMQKDLPLTQRGWALGTEHYAAPEQEQGKAEPVSDIYSMGVITYQMLTGLLPYQAVVRSRAADFPLPSSLNEELPSTVDAVVMRAMNVNPAKRFASGKEFSEAFDAALNAAEFASDETQAELAPTIFATVDNSNVLVRTIIPENPCGACGQENRSTSRFCRRCGHNLDETSPLVTDVCQVGYASDAGSHHTPDENEDMLLVSQGLCVNLAPPPRPFGLFAVADGLRGKHDTKVGGYEASHLAIETVADVLLPLLITPLISSTRGASRGAVIVPGSQLSRNKAAPPEVMLEQWLMDSVRRANQVIYHCNADYEATHGSTLTVALIYKRRFYVASVGDSRVYLFNSKAGLQRITEDHTLAADLIKAELFQPDEVYHSAKRDKLSRFLGPNYTVQVDVFQRDLEVDDLILLCTDGLWHMVRDPRIAELLQSHTDPQALAHILIDAANTAGGEGNISVVVVRVQ